MLLKDIFEQKEDQFKRIHIYLDDGVRTTISLDKLLVQGVASQIKDKSVSAWAQEVYNSKKTQIKKMSAENVSRLISQEAIKLIGGNKVD